MTPYERGFLTKCAEYGVSGGQAVELMKVAKVSGYGATQALAYGVPTLAGAGLGAGIGALIDRKKRRRGALWGALAGGAAGAGGAALNIDSGALNDMQRLRDLGNAGLLNVNFNPVEAALLLHGLGPKE